MIVDNAEYLYGSSLCEYQLYEKHEHQRGFGSSEYERLDDPL